LIAPLLPPLKSKPKGGRPRVPDRACLRGIVFVLRSGIPWEMLPKELSCSGMTCWRRLRGWQDAGIWGYANAREDTDYGYLWWLQTFHFHAHSLRSYGMYGTGGNKILVFPDESLVIVITTTNYRVQGASALTDKLIVDYILEAAVPANTQ
jgi:transposase